MQWSLGTAVRNATTRSAPALQFQRRLSHDPRPDTVNLMAMVLAVRAADLQGWVALIGGLAAAVLGILKYFDFRTRRARAAEAGQAFVSTVDALGSADEPKRLAGAILLRRFFDRSTEQGGKDAPYANEAVGVIAALLRGTETGTLQKILADGLAHAPSLLHADLQRCNLQKAYLGERPDRCPDLS